MRIITKQQGFFDFISGIPDRYIDIPEHAVKNITSLQTDY